LRKISKICKIAANSRIEQQLGDTVYIINFSLSRFSLAADAFSAEIDLKLNGCRIPTVCCSFILALAASEFSGEIPCEAIN